MRTSITNPDAYRVTGGGRSKILDIASKHEAGKNIQVKGSDSERVEAGEIRTRGTGLHRLTAQPSVVLKLLSTEQVYRLLDLFSQIERSTWRRTAEQPPSQHEKDDPGSAGDG